MSDTFQADQLHPGDDGTAAGPSTGGHGIREVVARGMCVGCGACGVRTSGAIPVTLGRFGVYQASLDGVSAEKIAAGSRVCPFSDDSKNEDVLGAARFPQLPKDDRVGHYHSVFAGRLTDDERLMGSSSGGLTSFLLAELLRTGRVDAVLHVGREGDEEMFGYRVSTTPEQIIDNRKSAYYATSFDEMVEQVRGDGLRYAVVGVPCFIRALRLLADEIPELAEQFTLYVGLVCGHLKSQFFAESLAWQAGVAPDKLETVDFRVKNPTRRSSDYDYAATPRGGGKPAQRATKSAIDGSWGYGAFQPEACNFCDDIFAETADVVFADGWLPQYVNDWRGTNIVVVRDPELRALFDAAHERGEITLDELTPDDAAKSQGGNFRHRRVGLRVRLADDAKAGLSIPRKRVEPGYEGVPRKRVAIIRQRRKMSALSLTAFEEARRRGRLEIYTKPMRSAIRKYVLLDAYSKGLVPFGRVVGRMLRGKV
jgi:coenzyme F420 hydrogenase subunit beta